MQDLQSLIQMAQAAQGGGARPPAMTQAPTAQDPLAALQALLGRGGPAGGDLSPANPMMSAISSLIAPGMHGPATDGDLSSMSEEDQAVRGDLMKKGRGGDYVGYSDDMMSEPDIRQTPMPMRREDDPDLYRPNIGAPGAPGQAIMGAYMNRNKGAPSTEDELSMVQKNMGSGDPVDDGNFPSQKDIDMLNSGKIDPKAFDAKWGKGAAKEMMEDPDTDNDPTTRKIPGESDDDDGDHEYR